MRMSSRRGGVDIGMVVIIVVVAIGLFFAYNAYEKRNRRLEREERIRMENERLERERAEVERKMAEEKAELERERQRKERERAEAEREAERNAAKKKLEEAAAERERQIKENDRCRTEYAAARGSFQGYEARIWEDVEAGERPGLDSRALAYWCVFSTYENDKLLYRVTTDASGKMSVQSFNGVTLPGDVDAAAFAVRCQKEKNAVALGDAVWLRGMPKNGSYYAVPAPGESLVAAAAECGDFYGVLSGLGVSFGEKRCRLKVCSSDGRQPLLLGIFGYDASVSRGNIVDLISSALAKGKRQGAYGADIAKPKLKRFKPTVVFYDGVLVKKDMSGVTHIPRKFEYRGTSHYKSYNTDAIETARKNWESLRDEAVRQENMAAEVEEENRRILEDYEAKKQKLADSRKRAAMVSSDDVEKEVGKWRIQIERSRGQKKSNRGGCAPD